MEYRPEMQFPDMPIPDAKGARRAASFCAFAAVAETAIAYLFIIAFSFLTRDAAFDSDTYNDHATTHYLTPPSPKMPATMMRIII